METLYIGASREVFSNLLPVLLVIAGDSIGQDQVLLLCPMTLGGTVLVLCGSNLVEMGVILLPFDNGLNLIVNKTAFGTYITAQIQIS